MGLQLRLTPLMADPLVPCPGGPITGARLREGGICSEKGSRRKAESNKDESEVKQVYLLTGVPPPGLFVDQAFLTPVSRVFDCL